MKHVTKLGLTLWVLGALTSAALAQEITTPPAQTEDWDALRTQVKEMREKAREMRNTATALNAVEQKACWDKFLVSSCQTEAKKTLRTNEHEAKRLEVEASHIQRQIQSHERDVKKQRQRDEAPQRAAESAQRGAQIRLKEAEAARRMEEKQADIKRREHGGN